MRAIRVTAEERRALLFSIAPEHRFVDTQAGTLYVFEPRLSRRRPHLPVLRRNSDEAVLVFYLERPGADPDVARRAALNGGKLAPEDMVE